jgi:hypothetical protein
MLFKHFYKANQKVIQHETCITDFSSFQTIIYRCQNKLNEQVSSLLETITLCPVVNPRERESSEKLAQGKPQEDMNSYCLTSPIDPTSGHQQMAAPSAINTN